jgi:tRNA(Ile)-lysidine synthase
MQSNLVTRLERYCRERSLLKRGDRVLVAVSGGVDSVVLLDLLSKLRLSEGLRLRVAHINHQLRGKESEGDEAFVQRLAHNYGLSFVVEKVNTAAYARRHRLSLQEAARELRYASLVRIAKKNNEKIATAHNANDNAETFLLNLCRGAGLSGLSGIPVLRSDIDVIRPFLFASRNEIEEYARKNGLKYRTDSSNREVYYRRNLIRRRILPLLQKSLNPEVVRTLNRTSEIFSSLNDFILHEAEDRLKRLVELKDNRRAVKLAALRTLHPFIQSTIVELLARQSTGIPLSSDHVRRILTLADAPVGKRVEASKDLVVYRDRSHLVFTRRKAEPRYMTEVQPNKGYAVGDFWFSSKIVPRRTVRWTNDPSVEFVDADRLNSRLILRPWKKGDRFVPLGMKGKKKLSDFLIDAKIPLDEKPSIPVLESHGNIVWVCGVRLDDRYRVTDATRNVLRLEFERKES